MFNIRHLFLLTLVAFIATTVYAQSDEDISTDVPKSHLRKMESTTSVSEKCTAVMNKYNASKCLTFQSRFISKPTDEDIKELDTFCSDTRDLCSTDQASEAIDAFEKDCADELQKTWSAPLAEYKEWFYIPFKHAIQCAKAGDKYCVFENALYSKECTDCQRETVRAALKAKLDRKPTVINITWEGTDYEMAEEKAEPCGVDIEELIEESKDGDDDGDENSAAGLYTNILGTLLVTLSATVPSQ